MMVAWNLALDLKYVVQRAVRRHRPGGRPRRATASLRARGQPAGATVIVIMIWPLLKSTVAKVVACTVASAVVPLTALDRVFLGVHFPSDVTAGVLMGSGLALASYAGYRGWNPAHPTDLPDTPEDVDAAVADAERADAHTGSTERPEENPR